ncbi:hypothetical protein JB92DRAFT_3121336 [Gautieria morchelliformis]|nr:hypothetical protein JB92DRAFT_3121336 [Gautieria morchelliformis]
MSSLAEVGALCWAIFGNQIAAIVDVGVLTYENPDGYDSSVSGMGRGGKVTAPLDGVDVSAPVHPLQNVVRTA